MLEASASSSCLSDSTNYIKEGVELVDKTGVALGQITKMVTNLNGLMGDISDATTVQSENLTEINRSVSELDQVTQQNAAMAEETTVASYELGLEASRLNGVTAAFTLQDRPDNETSRDAA